MSGIIGCFVEVLDRQCQRLLHMLDVALHRPHHHLGGDRFCTFVPDIVVCDMGDHRVSDFSLACEKGFRAGCHPDDAATPLAENAALTLCAEARPLDNDERAPILRL